MKRLLIVVNDPAFFLSHRIGIATAAREAGYDVHIATSSGTAVEVISRHGFAWHEVPIHRSSLGLVSNLRTLRSLFRLYRRLKPSLVHHVTPKPVVFGSIAAKFARIGAVVNAISGLGYVFSSGRESSLVGRVAQGLYRFAMRHPNLQVVLQNSDDRSLFLKAGIAKADAITLIKGSGVDLKTYRPADARPSGAVVIQTGRCLREKGVGEFIEAAAIVRRRYPEAQFILAGDVDAGNPGSYTRHELATLAQNAGVEWLGPRSDVPDLLRAASIYCLASYREGLPKSLIEAAATGLPLISTDAPGCREVIRHRANGLLVPPRNVQALADAIVTLIKDPVSAWRMGDEARADAEREYGLQGVIEQHLAIYDNLLRSSRQR